MHASIWDKSNFALTLGSIMAVTIVAFQGLAIATITPVLTRDLNGEHLYGWVFNAFLIPQIIGTVLGGREVDRRAPWQVFYPAMALFALGLLICAMSESMAPLLIGRMFVGFGCGAMFSTIYAIIGASYNDALRPAMLAAISTAWIVPSLIGPVIAGSIADHLHWRWVFIGLLPLVALSGALSWKTYSKVELPQDPEAALLNQNRLPLAMVLALGTFLFLAGPDIEPLARLLGANQQDVPFAVVAVVTIAGIVLIAPTLRKLMPAGTFTLTPMLPATIAARALTFGGFVVVETYVVYALKEFGELTSSQAGILLTVGSLTWTAGSVTQARLDRHEGPAARPRRMLMGAIGMLLGSAVIVLDVVLTQDIHWPIAMVAWAVVGFGIGVCFTTATAVAFQYAPTGQDGVVSSSFLLLDLFANAIGVGIGGFMLTTTIDRGWSQPQAASLAMSLAIVLLMAAVWAALRMTRHPQTAGDV